MHFARTITDHDGQREREKNLKTQNRNISLCTLALLKALSPKAGWVITNPANNDLSLDSLDLVVYRRLRGISDCLCDYRMLQLIEFYDCFNNCYLIVIVFCKLLDFRTVWSLSHGSYKIGYPQYNYSTRSEITLTHVLEEESPQK